MKKEQDKNFYRALYKIRRVEEEIIRIYPSDKIKSPVHLSIGQEAVSVGVCAALKPADVVYGTYRGHAMYIAKGGDLKSMFAELYGKITGCARGKGGSMHLVSVEHYVMGTSAIVGTGIPLAVGHALGLKFRKSDSVVVCFFGDGAVDEGAFHESMNFAALKKLPVLFVCENNFWAIHSHHLERHHSDNITERARTYGMPGTRIESSDIFQIHEETARQLEYIRGGNGPSFIECITCRWKEHVGPGDDFFLGYRNEEEVECWKQNDQLVKLKAMVGEKDSARIESEVDKEIEDAIQFAEESQFPGEEELYRDVFLEA